jgi:hypothetical protein
MQDSWIIFDERVVEFMAQAVHKEHFGVISDDQARTMSGLEFVQGLVDGTLPLNPMAETLGYDIVDVSKGRRRCRC